MQVARTGRVDALGEWLTCDGLDALRDSATTIVSRVTKIELGERNAERWNQHGYYRQAEEVGRRRATAADYKAGTLTISDVL
jgi:hypothetical protein